MDGMKTFMRWTWISASLLSVCQEWHSSTFTGAHSGSSEMVNHVLFDSMLFALKMRFSNALYLAASVWKRRSRKRNAEARCLQFRRYRYLLVSRLKIRLCLYFGIVGVLAVGLWLSFVLSLVTEQASRISRHVMSSRVTRKLDEGFYVFVTWGHSASANAPFSQSAGSHYFEHCCVVQRLRRGT